MIDKLSNLENKQPHEGSEALLTCANVIGFPGKARHNSISCDQVAAKYLGNATRYQSLQFNFDGIDVGVGHGGVAISYRQDGSPLPGLHSPLEIYHHLFGGNISREEQLRALKERKSIFDIMKLEINRASTKLSREDSNKLDEYSSSIRDMEHQLSREAEWIDRPYPKATIQAPKENLGGEATIRLMYKMIVTAFQVDASRIITYRMHDQHLLKELNIRGNSHTLSHYGSNQTLHEYNLIRTKKLMELYAHFIDLLLENKDPLDPNGKSLFENTLAYCGGGLRTSHRNTHVPCLLTGGGFNGLTHGKFRVAPQDNYPLANLWTSMLQDAGAPIEKFADATGNAKSILS